VLVYVIGFPLVSAAAFAGFEQLTGDAATRLAFQIRNQAFLLKLSGETTRTFNHDPWPWPHGVAGDYEVKIAEGPFPTRSGHRSLSVSRNLTKRAWSATTYHLNFVEVPADVTVSHRAGEDTRVTLEMKDGRVILTKLE
jgi:hypothetical protein